MKILYLLLCGWVASGGLMTVQAGETAEESPQVAHEIPMEVEEEEEEEIFDPQTYTCERFLDELERLDESREQDSDLLFTAVTWAHGYYSAIFSTDDTGPLNEETMQMITEDFERYCRSAPGGNFSRAAKSLVSE